MAMQLSCNLIGAAILVEAKSIFDTRQSLFCYILKLLVLVVNRVDT